MGEFNKTSKQLPIFFRVELEGKWLVPGKHLKFTARYFWIRKKKRTPEGELSGPRPSNKLRTQVFKKNHPFGKCEKL